MRTFLDAIVNALPTILPASGFAVHDIPSLEYTRLDVAPCPTAITIDFPEANP